LVVEAWNQPDLESGVNDPTLRIYRMLTGFQSTQLLHQTHYLYASHRANDDPIQQHGQVAGRQVGLPISASNAADSHTQPTQQPDQALRIQQICIVSRLNHTLGRGGHVRRGLKRHDDCLSREVV